MIFVTGGTGFLGSNLIRNLVDSGKTVRAFKRKNSDISFLDEYADKVEWVEGDLLDIVSIEEALENVEQVYHCAAVVSFMPSDRERMFTVNIEGTENIVNGCLAAGIKKLLHVSSIAALGRTKNKTDISEKSKWENDKLNTNYAISKFLSENEVWRGIIEGLCAVIVNPSVIIGSRNWSHGGAKIFPLVWKGLRYYTKGTNGFVDVNDVVRCMTQLMESEISEERFIISSDNWSYKKMLDEIADQLDKPRPSRLATSFKAGAAWRFEAMRSILFNSKPLITRETVAIGQQNFCYDNTKIKKELNFEFTPLEITIQEVSEMFKESVNGKKGN